MVLLMLAFMLFYIILLSEFHKPLITLSSGCFFIVLPFSLFCFCLCPCNCLLFFNFLSFVACYCSLSCRFFFLLFLFFVAYKFHLFSFNLPSAISACLFDILFICEDIVCICYVW